MFVADQKVVGGVKKGDVKCSDSSDMDLTLKCLQEIDRQDLDFTEELWNVLRGVCFMWLICLLLLLLLLLLHDLYSANFEDRVRGAVRGLLRNTFIAQPYDCQHENYSWPRVCSF